MKTIILSLGGSIIAPDKPDYFFLKEFKNFILRHLDNYRFIIVCGGGRTNTYYNEAAKRVSEVSQEDLDWIGIMATRLNAELVRAIFGALAEDKVVYDPHVKAEMKKPILVAAGWKPGCSTDYDSVILAKNLGVKEVINLTNIEYIYDSDPRENKDAKKLFSVSWKEYRKIVGDKWTPRMSSPFDPIASREAEMLGLRVAVLKGTDLGNLEDYLASRSYRGSVID